MSDFIDVSVAYRQKGKTKLVKRKKDCQAIYDLDTEKNIIVVLS
jgi:hypothetical protein